MQDLLDWLSQYKGLCIYYQSDEDEKGCWIVDKNRLGEYICPFEVIGDGNTPKEALDKARKYLNKKVDK